MKSEQSRQRGDPRPAPGGDALHVGDLGTGTNGEELGILSQSGCQVTRADPRLQE